MRGIQLLLRRFRSLLPARGGRQRGQGLVEYGVITACLAFAGIAGFSSLAAAQKSYLTTFPKNVPAPSVSSQLYHPTFMHWPVCTWIGSPADPQFDTVIYCSQMVVHDTFSDPAQRLPPKGTVELLVDGMSKGSCTLNVFDFSDPADKKSWCDPPLSLNFTPGSANRGKTLGVVARYTPKPNTYHFASSSDPPILIQIAP